ncbi:Yip1-domain-containing protein [Lentinula edodes]|uniref:Yip1-domain-containing protein n=1 Tax=Lentinula edodes TaxID=5353 RepID=A0A1Q3ECJ6_LENED|nr:Yip1-domain-containing protein [Lentinula edodes]
MAYVAVEADERLEEGPEGLQFKSFLGDNTSNTRPGSAGVSNVDRGYLSDQPHPRKSGGGFWTVEYYQVYFEVDTKEISTDLFGLSRLLYSLSDGEYDYDFGLLSQAVGIVYAYGLGLPVLLWISLRYMGVGEWSVVDAVAIWGYALFVWIPVSILCVIPVPLLRWVLVFLAFASSGYFLIRNIYPILASAEAKATRLLIIVIGVLHAALALVFKVLFFGYYVVDKIGMDLPLPGGNDPNSAGGAVKMLDVICSFRRFNYSL